MTDSDRSSGRAAEPSENSLVSGPEGGVSDADDKDLLAPHNARPGGPVRLGRQHLAQLKSSLSDRHLAVMRSIDLLKFASAKQIERLIYPSGDGELTALSATRSCRRELAQIVSLGLLERLDRRIGGFRAGSAGFIYCLTPGGRRLLGGDAQRRGRQPSTAHLEHVLAVAEIVVGVHEAARDNGGEVLVTETEPDCWRPLIGPGGGRQQLKPDLRLVLAVGEQELHWFIELDRGTEHRPVLGRKCQAFLTAWQQGREQAEHGVFPRVLWVVPEERRADVLREVITGLSAPDGMFIVCTTDEAIDILCGERGGGA